MINFLRTRWYSIALVPTSYIYYQVAPLKVDAHHDGVILGTAIGVADGHPILSGAFSQYGPLPGLIQGLVLNLFDTQLLTLRYFTALQCLVIGSTIYKLCREYVKLQMARLLSLFWLLASCIWVTQFPGSLIPWPSLMSTFLVMMGLMNLNKSARLDKNHFAILAGVFFGLAGFCRIQAFIILPVIYIFGRMNFSELKRLQNFSFLGYVITLLLFFTYLAKIESLDDYIRQSITTPLLTYSGIGESHNYNRFYVVLYTVQAVNFIFILFLAKYLNNRMKKQSLAILVMTAVLSLSGFLGSAILRTEFPIRLKVIIGEPLENLVISALFFGCVSSIPYLILLLRKKSQYFGKISFQELIVILASLATIPQLYPQADIMHLWWLSPIFLCNLSALIGKNQELIGFIRYQVVETVLISSIIIGIIMAVVFIERPKVEYKVNVLRGTYSDSRTAQSLDIFGIIEKYAVRGDTSFDCEDGVFSVIGGRYLAADEWFINWGYSREEPRSLGSVRVICDKAKAYALAESLRLEMQLVYYQQNAYGRAVAILMKRE